MASRLARQLANDRRFRTWRNLPPAFVEEAATLPDEEVLDLAARLWKLHTGRKNRPRKRV